MCVHCQAVGSLRAYGQEPIEKTRIGGKRGHSSTAFLKVNPILAYDRNSLLRDIVLNYNVTSFA